MMMLTLLIRSSLSPPSLSHNLHFTPTIPFISFFSSLTPNPKNPNPIFLNYLIHTLGFTKTRALSASNRFSWITTLEKPQSVVQFLKNLGFSDTHMRCSIHCSPQILFSDIEKTLKPKLQFFQEMGLSGSELGKFMSKNSKILTCSLDKKLKPCIAFLKTILVNDDKNKDLILVLWRCNWLTAKNPESRLISNVLYLKSCGIIGSQLSMLLKRQPRLFMMRETHLRSLVSKVLDMGFSMESKMFVHGLYTVSCISNEKFVRKLELLQSFGFSKIECMEMFRRAPGLFSTSEEKLKLGIEFFMNTMKFDKASLVHMPTCLMNSMEERVIPRYIVLQILKSKRLLKKDPSFINVLSLTEEVFLEKFISRFTDDAEQLLMAYKGHILDC